MPKRKIPPTMLFGADVLPMGHYCPNPLCNRFFQSQRGLTPHMNRNPVCSVVIRDMMNRKLAMQPVEVKQHLLDTAIANQHAMATAGSSQHYLPTVAHANPGRDDTDSTIF